MKRSMNLCVVLVMASTVILGQSARTPSTKTPVKPTPENHLSEQNEMREHQLRMFREQVLTRALDNIKKMDEAGLRISVRNQILTYLGSEKSSSVETR